MPEDEAIENLEMLHDFVSQIAFVRDNFKKFVEDPTSLTQEDLIENINFAIVVLDYSIMGTQVVTDSTHELHQEVKDAFNTLAQE